MNSLVITKDKTAIIKGVAILLMIVHHCLIKEFYIEPTPIMSSVLCWKLCSFNKICVALFTFFVGYGAFYSYKTFGSYFKKHVGTLLKYYWFYLFILAIPLVALAGKCNWGGKYIVDTEDIILNSFGLKHGYCLGNWYVYFYIYCLLLLPVLTKFLNNRIYLKTIIIAILCGILFYVTSSTNIYLRAISECMFYTPVLVVGYICAKTQILSKLGQRVNSKMLWFAILIFISLVRIVGGGGHWGISSDTVIAPLVIISITALFIGKETSWTAKALTSLGNNSTMMWFVHCLFFSSATKEIFQSLKIWPSNILWVFVCVTIISYLVSIILNVLFKKIKYIS